MTAENTVLFKSYAFAQRIVKLYKLLLKQKQPRALAEQLLRSGTSIGANIEEATGGFSRRDFAAKCSIAYKEARETHYWLRLLRDTECLDIRLADSLIGNAEELKRMLAAIILSTRNEDISQVKENEPPFSTFN
ncbi:four helix bundle protein [Hymenobacter sp. ASUV-10]|uniref:Four helix bundle protein n=1 Tax=Hymenobacter aranciens TaxID=3063996 RepID=A0ABT9BF84_9BACT|nr:four helix bundle protein [Hymenobacter sp. ASUV-10]MDO7876935.1 four helix bundle protein [Hymenobacter sp. ASUV-10]